MRRIHAVRRTAIALAALASLVFGLSAAQAQFVSPTCTPPNCSPAVIQNIPLTGTTQSAGINITGDAKLGATLQVGASGPVLNAAGQNLIYGNIGATSSAGSLMLLQKGGSDRLRLDFSGNLSPSGSVLAPLGAVGTPTYAFSGDASTGLYSPAVGQVGVTTAGAQRMTWSAAGTTVAAGQVLLPSGTPAAPAITFTGDANLGIYRSGIDTLNFATNGVSRLQIDATGAVTVPGTFSVAGSFSAASFSGDGSGLTNLGAANVTTGMLPDARLSPNVAFLNGTQTFSGANVFSNASNSFTGNGAGLTGISASNITVGTLPAAQLPAAVAFTNATQTFTGADTFSNASNSFTGNGAGLTALNASNITTGTLQGPRLSGTYGNGLVFAGLNQYTNMSLFGGSALTVAAGQNLLYGNVAAGSTGNLLLLQKNSSDQFRVDSVGNVIAAGTITSGGQSVCLANGVNCPPTISGSGTAGRLARFTPTGSTLGDSSIQDNGTRVGVGGVPGASDLLTVYGNLNVGSGTLFADAAAGKVGIGTSTPTAKLDFGTGSANAKLIIGTYVSGNNWTGIGMDAATAGLRFAGDNGGGNPVADFGYYSNDAAHNWTNVVRVGHGAVGVGTTAPRSTFDVQDPSTGMAVNFGGAPQSQYTDLVLSSNINNAQIFDTGSSFAGWAGPGSLNLYTSSGPIGFHPAGNANALYLGASGLVSLGTTAQPSRLYVEDWGNAAGSGAGRFFEGAAGGYALAGIAQTSAVGAGDEYGVWAQADTNSGNAYAVYATASCISCGSPVWGVYIARGGAAKPGGGSWSGTSDRRVKKDIAPFTDGLDLVRKIDPVNYTYNGLGEMPEGYHGIGVIAQDLKKVAPYMVASEKRKLRPTDAQKTDLYVVDPSAFAYININAIKQLDLRVDGLEARLVQKDADQDQRIQTLEEEVKDLKAQIDAMKR